MTYVEAVSALSLLRDMEPEVRKHILSLMVRYFLLNPVKIMHCPFLDQGKCTIYEHRFLGCRTYGLWSEQFYTKSAARSHEARRHVHEAWERAGINIPAEIREFRVPYCADVKVRHGKKPNDRMLLKLGRKIAALSEEFSPEMHQSFTYTFYMDLSFWLVSLANGPEEAAKLKFLAVRQAVIQGKTDFADETVLAIADYLHKML
jgi:Fe-S-cluster containining protein